MNIAHLNKKYKIIIIVILLWLFLMAFSFSYTFDVYASSNTNLKVKSYEAYYDFLMDESNNIGKPIRETSLYQKDLVKYTDGCKTSDWTDKKITAAYLLDVTGDGIEDLIIRKLIDMPLENPRTIFEPHGVLDENFVLELLNFMKPIWELSQT